MISIYASPLSQTEFRTTDGTIALINLNSQIAGQLRQALLNRFTIAQQAGLIELIVMRGQFLSQIADYEWADRLADRLVQNASTDSYAFFARAKTHAVFHRFRLALADLDRAECYGMERPAIDAARATIFQAIGQYEQAFILRQSAATAQPTINTLGTFAALQFEQGAIAEAEHFFATAQACYRGISPFPIVWLYFQQGHLWLHAGNLQQAREFFEAACNRFPAYAAAQGHLAEVLVTLGDDETAIALLRPLAESSDDPDFASQLSRILSKSGQTDEAMYWRNVATNRYDELTATYPEAFADHAAQFWLSVAFNPQKALQFARKNLEVRQTPRAYRLLDQAMSAYQKTAIAS